MLQNTDRTPVYHRPYTRRPSYHGWIEKHQSYYVPNAKLNVPVSDRAATSLGRLVIHPPACYQNMVNLGQLMQYDVQNTSTSSCTWISHWHGQVSASVSHMHAPPCHACREGRGGHLGTRGIGWYGRFFGIFCCSQLISYNSGCPSVAAGAAGEAAGGRHKVRSS